MNEYVKIEKVIKKNKLLQIKFSTSENLKKYFFEKYFFCEYDFFIEDIPNSILVIPFVSNILPITWLTNAEIILDEIDADFFYSIENFKDGYLKMYPKVRFYDTKIKCENIVENVKKSISNQVGTFFSGGVDAYSTLYSHIKQNPILITIWGADIEINNLYGWNNMKTVLEDVSNLYNLKSEVIKSNFKEFLNTAELNRLILESSDKWWHGFQHGIGLISLSAPVSYKYNLYRIYIASSHTEKDNVTCASSPMIDNFIKFCNTEIIHDQFELNRQMKINRIVKISNEINKYPNLHVCWENPSGENCCKCEKCCRTIIGLMISNDNPEKYGFKKVEGRKIKRRMTLYNSISKTAIPLWNDMKEEYIKNKSINRFKNEIGWIEKYNFDNQHVYIKKICRKIEKIFNNRRK